MVLIAVLLPLCSRNQHYTDLASTPLFSRFLPAFERTKSSEHVYKIYLGYDDDDAFYLHHGEELAQTGTVLKLTGCQHAPAWAWNQLMARAYEDGCEYFFQIGEDVILECAGWTEAFLSQLQAWNDEGVVGPCDPINHGQRVRGGGPIIVENAFLSRKHYVQQRTLFHPEIKNWYCDVWLSEIYKPDRFRVFTEFPVQNTIRDQRYQIFGCPRLPEFVQEGKARRQ